MISQDGAFSRQRANQFQELFQLFGVFHIRSDGIKALSHLRVDGAAETIFAVSEVNQQEGAVANRFGKHRQKVVSNVIYRCCRRNYQRNGGHDGLRLSGLILPGSLHGKRIFTDGDADA